MAARTNGPRTRRREERRRLTPEKPPRPYPKGEGVGGEGSPAAASEKTSHQAGSLKGSLLGVRGRVRAFRSVRAIQAAWCPHVPHSLGLSRTVPSSCGWGEGRLLNHGVPRVSCNPCYPEALRPQGRTARQPVSPEPRCRFSLPTQAPSKPRPPQGVPNPLTPNHPMLKFPK